MSHGRQYIPFEGHLAKSVPGIFQIIWNFVELRTGKLRPDIMAIFEDAGAMIHGGDL